MKLKLKYKILLLFATVSLVVLLIIGGLISYRLKRERLTSIYQSLQGQLIDINFTVTGFFTGIERDLEGIVANPYVQSKDDDAFTRFVNADASSFEYHINEQEQKIIDVFSRYRNSHDHVNSVYMGRENGSFVRSHKRSRPTRYDPRERPWYLLGKKNPGKILHTAPYSSVTTTDVNIGIVTALLNEDGSVYGVAGIDVTLDNLTQYIEKIRVGRNGYLILVDADGTILAARDESIIFQSIEAICKDNLNALFEQKKGAIAFSRNNQKHYLVFSHSPVLDWKIAFVLPSEEIDREVGAFVFQVVIVLAISLFLLSVLTLFGLEYFVVKPLSKLNEGTEIIAKTGDLDHRIHISSEDEIGNLSKSFNRMTRDLKSHIEKLTETTAAKERMESELRIAREIQMDLLPNVFPAFPDRDEFDIYAAIEPAKQVGGDLYDFFFIDDNRLFFVIGDVSDKGVPAALFMARAKAVIRATAKNLDSPNEILDVVNKELNINNDSMMFVTIFCGMLAIDTGAVFYTNAGHNPPLLVRPDKTPEFLDKTGDTALGFEPDLTFKKAEIILQPGDAIFMYTDGVTEAFNEKDEEFSEKRLKTEVTLHSGESIENLVMFVMERVQVFSGDAPQSDDITLLGLKYLHGSRQTK
ncbi:MAG: SpoIIE family protein phosphatase [Deltaproteobacteria bacterium]|nr:SpoIIE family protein phosphatase [Deltaproteobacteria bacterium]